MCRLSRTNILMVGASIALAMLCLLVGPLFGQVQFGEMTGLVSDPSGGVVPEAAVTVSNQQTGVKKTTVTNPDGNYTVTPLIAGLYDVTVSKTGFKTSTKTGIRLDVAESARVDLTLELGEVTQTVEVKASVAMLQTEDTSVGSVVAESGVVNLPLNGRNYLQLATLVPGTTSQGLSVLFFNLPTNNIVVNGGRESATNYVIDGTNVMEQFTSGSSFTPAPDAIQEFKVETSNMDAKYGGGSSVINAVLKSGTNRLHGTAYEFLRNDAMDSRNFFAPTTPPLKQSQFGGTFGGPIRKDKTFFFGDYQGTRYLTGTTSDSIVPSAAERTGDFSQLLPTTQLTDPYTGAPLKGNIIPAVAPQSAYLLQQFFPLPNTSAGTYVQSPAATDSVNQFDVKIDHQIDPSDYIAASYGLADTYVYSPGPFPLNGATFGPSRAMFGNFSWTHNLGPTKVNQAHAAYSREHALDNGQGIGKTNYTSQAGISGFDLTGADYPGPPGMSISGYAGLNGYPFVPLPETYNQTIFGDVLTWVKGKHTIEIGGDARWYAGFNLNGAWSRGQFYFTGVYTGDGLADYMYGLPFQGSRGFPRNWFGLYQQTQDGFVQDTWKVTPKLTLIGGLRYDLIHPDTPLHGMYASTNIARDTVIVSSNQNGKINTNTQQMEAFLLPLFGNLLIPSSEVGLSDSLIHIDLNNFAPRLGLAYQFGHGFVGRAAYGVFYPLEQQNQEFSTGGANIPFLADELGNYNTTPVPTKNLGNMFPELAAGSVTAAQLGQLLNFTIDPWQRDPYVQEWNFTLQKLIGSALSLQASYVGTKGTKLTFATPTNVPLPGPGDINDRRPNTTFAQGAELGNGGLSNYQALQVTAETRSWRGLYLLGAYTFGKALDDQTGDDQGSPVQDPNNLRAEYGVADFNVESRLTLSSTYLLPILRSQKGLVGSAFGGWTVSNIITLQTGSPFTPVPATDPANTGTSMRADRIANGSISDPTINEWFDPSAFTTPALYTYGNSQRNVLTGPGLRDWDFALFKDFSLSRVREGMRIQFRGEFFNFTNHPSFGLPSGTIGTASAAEIFSAGAPREIQLALKVIF
jgi:outer membrane receptor protein involved in Fe transport